MIQLDRVVARLKEHAADAPKPSVVRDEIQKNIGLRVSRKKWLGDTLTLDDGSVVKASYYKSGKSYTSIILKGDPRSIKAFAPVVLDVVRKAAKQYGYKYTTQAAYPTSLLKVPLICAVTTFSAHKGEKYGAIDITIRLGY